MNGEQDPSKPETAKEWEELEAQTRARIGPPGRRYKQFLDELEERAKKEQEGREFSGDTDSEGEEYEADNESDEEDSGSEDETESTKREAKLTDEEIEKIRYDAANPSTRLGPLPIYLRPL
ncbi:hypothetical protein G7Y89_g8211 [Cudoniella acicularis]|uniref:Uncharacterized protein n=1 Tax=Cudoniella acicularis TaxID=354080 RepID=A0A8H4RJ24_9HELO|nr:hypothetical protein G7Y89_g8211 [Cudoniella acicularis]